MGIDKKNDLGKKSFAARKIDRDKYHRQAKAPTARHTAMYRSINQQLKVARVHNNDLATKLAKEGKISKAAAKVIRARYTKDKQKARNEAAMQGGLAFDDRDHGVY
ncbi:hypothetical protein MMC11_000753 [Xylographa trunciseda]|nr:hypothetical protein [Xylographa trunciseda]